MLDRDLNILLHKILYTTTYLVKFRYSEKATTLLTAEDGFFLWFLPTLHSSYQSLEQMHWFEDIFKNFGSAVFEVWLWYLSFCITYKNKSLRNNKKRQKNRAFEPFVIQKVCLTFSRLAAKLSELAEKILRSQPQNSTSNILWPQWSQKWHCQTFWKYPQINAFVPKIDGRYEL